MNGAISGHEIRVSMNDVVSRETPARQTGHQCARPSGGHREAGGQQAEPVQLITEPIGLNGIVDQFLQGHKEPPALLLVSTGRPPHAAWYTAAQLHAIKTLADNAPSSTPAPSPCCKQ